MSSPDAKIPNTARDNKKASPESGVKTSFSTQKEIQLVPSQMIYTPETAASKLETKAEVLSSIKTAFEQSELNKDIAEF